MTNDHHPAGRVLLPSRGGPGQDWRGDSGYWDGRGWDGGGWDGPRGARQTGIGHARRMSNWSAAALIVGTGAAVVALARGTNPATAPASVPAAAGQTAAQAAAPATRAARAGKPHHRAARAGTAATHRAPPASRSVATTSGSGVTRTAAGTTAGTTAGQSAPPVSNSVATTSASGVTTVTTTNPVTGKKTVTTVRHGGRGGDD